MQCHLGAAKGGSRSEAAITIIKDFTALRPYFSCTLGLLYMLKRLLSSSLMEVMKPGCPKMWRVEGLVYHNFIPNPFGPSER